MGLDIRAYKKLDIIDCVFDEDGEPIDTVTRDPIEDYFQPYHNPDFAGRADDLQCKSVYRYEESMSGWSGGYGAYNNWREQLSALAGYPAVETDRHGTGSITLRHDQGAWNQDGGKFWELICFSDCEGVIGADVSKKLLADFIELNDSAQKIGGRFYDSYVEWMDIFRFASDDGAVDFH